MSDESAKNRSASIASLIQRFQGWHGAVYRATDTKYRRRRIRCCQTFVRFQPYATIRAGSAKFGLVESSNIAAIYGGNPEEDAIVVDSWMVKGFPRRSLFPSIPLYPDYLVS